MGESGAGCDGKSRHLTAGCNFVQLALQKLIFVFDFLLLLLAIDLGIGLDCCSLILKYFANVKRFCLGKFKLMRPTLQAELLRLVAASPDGPFFMILLSRS